MIAIMSCNHSSLFTDQHNYLYPHNSSFGKSNDIIMLLLTSSVAFDKHIKTRLLFPSPYTDLFRGVRSRSRGHWEIMPYIFI